VGFWDLDGQAGQVEGVLAFGPAHLEGVVSEQGVTGYQVTFADECGRPLGGPVASVSAQPQAGLACCPSNQYAADIPAATPVPEGAEQFLIVTVTAGGATDVGLTVTFIDRATAGGDSDATLIPDGFNYEQSVQLTFVFSGVNYQLLMANPKVRADFENAVRQAVIVESGLNLSPELVFVVMSQGSVVVTVWIAVPEGSSLEELQQGLENAQSTISTAAATYLVAVEGINEVTDGALGEVLLGKVTAMKTSTTTTTTTTLLKQRASSNAPPPGWRRGWPPNAPSLMIAVSFWWVLLGPAL
jgi:hypothetical protein